MAKLARALMIACERYPKAEDVATQLKGTLEAARSFYTWLRESKRIEPTEIFLCCDDPVAPGHPPEQTYSGTRDGIVSAIVDLVEGPGSGGRDNTGELFVFFSGHGVGWEISPQRRGLDVLLTSDYRSRKKSGGACLKFDELRDSLSKWLGGEDHFYFLDACRTVMKIGEITPTDLGLTLDLATSGEPTTYVLYSTKFGEAASINSGFSQALLDGLKGSSRAKQKIAKDWWVKFDRLQKYVQERVKAKTDLAKLGSREGLILKLAEVLPTPFTVHVEGARPSDDFTLQIGVSGFAKEFPFTGGLISTTLQPNDQGYEIDLKSGDRSLPLLDPSPDTLFDLYDPVDLRFGVDSRTSAARGGQATGFDFSISPDDVDLPRLPDQGEVAPIPHTEGEGPPVPSGPPKPRSPASGLSLGGPAPPNVRIRARNAMTGESVDLDGQGWTSLPPGRHSAEVVVDGMVARRREFQLGLGERLTLNPFSESSSRVIRSIESRLPTMWGLPDASETLGGPIVQQNTALWLSLLGASRLVRDPVHFSKLGPLPLSTFGDLRQGECVLYALVGLDDDGSPKLGLGDNRRAQWRKMDPVEGLDGVYHRRVKVDPGPLLVSFRVHNMPPVTYAAFAFPNRAVLMVLGEEESGRLEMRQILLPVYSLREHLDELVRGRFESESLRLVKYLVLAQERYASRESLEPLTPEDKSRWKAMLDGDWIDPLLALMAVFDAARTGGFEAARPRFKKLFKNLSRFYGQLPDTAAAKALMETGGGPVSMAAPLLSESLQRVPDLKKKLPISADFLDFGSMWTSWFGAVKPPR